MQSGFYIDGAWRQPQSDQRFPVMNPATEKQVAEVILGNAADVDIAVAAAGKAFETFSRTSKAERLELLEKLLIATEARVEDLARAISTEMGAPITAAREAHADSAVGNLRAFIEALQDSEE